MNKNMKRLLSLLLCLCMTFGVLFTLASCSDNGQGDGEGNTGDANTPSDSQSESETEEEKFYSLNLTEAGTTKYVIIVPNKNKEFSEDMRIAVETLIRAFKNFANTEIEYKTDYMGRDENYEEIPPDENAYEILIGNTNRHQSTDALEGLGFGEYIIKADGNKLVINGTSTTTTANAVDYFIEKFIQGNKDLGYGKTDVNFVFTSDNNYKKESNYQVKSININGKNISSMKLVYPKNDMVAKYVASLIKRHVFTFSGVNLEIVEDTTAGYNAAIHVGKTKQSTITAESGKYQIQVTNKGLEIAVDDMFTYAAVYNVIASEVLAYSNPHISLELGQKWDGSSIKEANTARTTDIRLMYHNVWGYGVTNEMIAQGIKPNPVKATNVNRYSIAVEAYKAYNPDIICFQEYSVESTISDALILMGYSRVDAKNTSLHAHHSVWYKDAKLELVNFGSNKGWSSYHSSWIIFKVKETGEHFAICNSHFTADSMVNQSDKELIPQLGDEARKVDVQSLLKSVEAAKAAGPEGMPIITGGDYNCNMASGAYQALLDGGLTNVRDLADVCANISCHHGVEYDEDFGTYKLPQKVGSSVEHAIDHIMLYDAENSTLDIKEYGVIGDRMTAVSSDHAPHFVDFNFS